MSYRTVVVHCDHSCHAAARYALATQLACATHAHLAGVAATGLSRHAQWNGKPGAGPLLRNALAQRREQAQSALDAFAQEAWAVGVNRWSRCLAEDDAEEALALHARYADLLVLSQSDEYDVLRGLLRALPPELLFRAACPILVVPASPGARAPLAHRHALVAWDGGLQAARAMTDALPLLRLSTKVTVLMLNAGRHLPPGNIDPETSALQYLARHGVQAAFQRADTASDVGSALLNMAAKQHCDLLVMGAYRHRRVEEALIGGATRTVLRAMTLPVLLAR